MCGLSLTMFSKSLNLQFKISIILIEYEKPHRNPIQITGHKNNSSDPKIVIACMSNTLKIYLLDNLLFHATRAC